MASDLVPKSLAAKLSTWTRYGSKVLLSKAESKRLLLYNRVITSEGCWLWGGNTFGSGYGRLTCRVQRAMAATTGRVHVLAFILWKGDVPAGKYVCHKCDVKRCFNPKHLWPGTNSENQQDAARKGAWNNAWPEERRESKRLLNTGKLNPMFGKRGVNAPCYGRVGKLHPMYGKHHSTESRMKISSSLQARKRVV